MFLLTLAACTPVFLVNYGAGVEYEAAPAGTVTGGASFRIAAGDATSLLGAHASVYGGRRELFARVGLDRGWAVNQARVNPIFFCGPELGMALVSWRPQVLALGRASFEVLRWSDDEYEDEVFYGVDLDLRAGIRGNAGTVSLGVTFDLGGGGRTLAGSRRPR